MNVTWKYHLVLLAIATSLAVSAIAGAGDSPARGSLSYSFDAASTGELSQSAVVSLEIARRVTVLMEQSLATQPDGSRSYSGGVGADIEWSRLFTTRLEWTASGSNTHPLTGGAQGILFANLDTLWEGERATQVHLGVTGAQAWRQDTSASLAAGIDPNVYNFSWSAGLTRDLGGLDLGASYTYYGFTNGGAGRDSIAISVGTQWSGWLRTQLSLSSAKEAIGWRRAGGIALGVQIVNTAPDVVLGVHGSLFEMLGWDDEPRGGRVSPVGYSWGLDICLGW